MKYKRQNAAFGTMPVRAFMDMRFGSPHYRVLGVICFYDRLGYNGQGCTIGRKRMAAQSATSETHVSDAVGDLERWGYINVGRDEVDERKKSYRVIYTDADWNCMGITLKNRSTTADLSEQNRSPETADRSENTPRKVPGENAKSLTDNGGSVPNILRYKYKEEGEGSVSVEGKRYCAEARQPRKTKWTVESAEKYLSEVQSLPAEHLKWERSALSEIAEDVGLPDSVRDRAATLRDAA
jgi:hypothetical protein